ncbi:unnamed protein product [Caenorhabditis sp. 36 PRJEB53466]|nr:unnamed protein product [Caenorhabditis sp. 36 PRJEB53466]
MAIKLNGFHRSYVPSVRLTAFLILIMFVISSVILFNASFTDQTSSLGPRIDPLLINVEDIDDYDAGCSGYSFGRILREQKKILASVRAELAESQLKIEEIRTVQEELQRLIPQKQLELSALEGEIEAAQRQLEELRETQNVRVFLPFSPIQTPRIQHESVRLPLTQVPTLDDVIDYSRCSISSFMPVSVQTVTEGNLEKEWRDILQNVIPNLESNPEKACLTMSITNGVVPTDNRPNVVLFNIGEPVKDLQTNSLLMQHSQLRSFDLAIDANSISPFPEALPALLPLYRNHFIAFILPNDSVPLDVSSLEESSRQAPNSIIIRNCSKDTGNCDRTARKELFAATTFCFLLPSVHFLADFVDSLRVGCIPIVLSNTRMLPFQDLIDWRRASHRMSAARLPEAHFIVRSFEIADVLEMRRMGRVFYENYLSDRKTVARSIIAALRYRLQIPTREMRSSGGNRAVPLFNSSFTAPKGSVVNVQPNFDDEYLLGPLESRIESTPYVHNFTEFQLYSYDTWNVVLSPHSSKEYLINAVEPPAEAEFDEYTKSGFRPIDPGSGVEFSKALGGNRQREQFTAVLLTYERDAVLVGALERLHQLPYLNKIIVVWNNVHRDPPETWPSLHVPVEFIRVKENSLNNRFVPWDRIETEAVLSLDDDIDLMQQEIVLAFRVWRENRERIVGFPARHHARYGDSMFYNSNHTCQMSMILTGAAFIHKNYLSAYTYQMPSVIREHVDRIRNCEDIAMNYLVSHLTRRPPIKTTSRWTLKCPTCTESLFKEDSHFEKRHECMRLFTEVFGYNPLRFSQFRADSILFKTRLPQNHQKCFKYV